MREEEWIQHIPRGETLRQELNAAYRLYQDNIRETGELIYQITKGAREGLPERELLDMALQALDKCRYEGEAHG